MCLSGGVGSRASPRSTSQHLTALFSLGTDNNPDSYILRQYHVGVISLQVFVTKNQTLRYKLE